MAASRSLGELDLLTGTPGGPDADPSTAERAAPAAAAHDVFRQAFTPGEPAGLEGDPANAITTVFWRGT